MNRFKMLNDIRWIGPERKSGIETTYFKTIFTMPKIPEQAILHISANERFCLYINGAEILHGPCRGDHWHQYCDTIDVLPFLAAGTNIIAVKVTAYEPFEVTNDDKTNSGPLWAMSNAAGPMLICWSEGFEVSTGRADWYYLNDNAISWKFEPAAFWMGCTESVDGCLLPHKWQSEKSIGSDFTLAKLKWNNQVMFGEINPLFLYERPIKYLLRKEPEFLSEEISVPANTTYEAVFDTKQLTTAFIYLCCTGGAGSSITMLYAEAFSKPTESGRQRYKGVRSDATGELAGISDIYRPGGSEEIYSPSWFRTFRFIKLTIVTKDDPVTISPIKYTETRYPVEDKVKFEANDWIRKVWDISLRTLELCMHESYEDCPFYEQLQYTMDTRLQMIFTYVISGDSSLQLKAIHDYHTSMLPEGILQCRFPSKLTQVIPGFSLHWIFMLKDYYIEAGSTALPVLERYRTTMESVLAWFKRKTGPLGLVEHVGYWDFCDWTDAWDDIHGTPRAALSGPSTIHNLVYAYALQVGGFIMNVCGFNCLAEAYKKERAALLKKVDELCWSEEKGLYREGPGFEEYSQHAQIWAVLNKLAAGEKARNLMQIVLSDKSLVQCSFVMQYYMFRALEEAGMYMETEKLWKLWQDLIELDLTTVPEIPGNYSRSDCHAWGSLLLHELPRKFLGVQPLLPGYEKVVIQPKAFYVKKISGSVPTPHGDVSVRWEINNGVFSIEGNTPISAEVILPDGTCREAIGGFSYSIVTGGTFIEME